MPNQFFVWNLALAVLLGTFYTAAEVSNPLFPKQLRTVAATPQLQQTARQITVRIDGKSSYGSGVLVEREGKTYYVLTNAHVVNKPESYQVVTPDGKVYPVNAGQITRIAGVDLAVLSFFSELEYPVAAINHTSSVQSGEKIYVAGWSRSGGSLRQRVFVVTEGALTKTESELSQGYSLTYTNIVRAGMSGGPILNSQGELIGINGLVRLAKRFPSGERGVQAPGESQDAVFGGNLRSSSAPPKDSPDPERSPEIVASGIEIATFWQWRSLQARPWQQHVATGTPAPSNLAQPGKSFAIEQTLSLSEGAVNSVAVDSDNKIFALCDSKGKISIGDLATGKIISSWQAHPTSVNAIVISPDGQILASASEDKTIKLWHLPTGKLINTLKGHQDTVTSLAFNSEGNVLASGSWDKTVKLWQPATGKLLKTLTGHTGLVGVVAISPKGNLIASGSHDQTIRLWDTATGKLLQTLTGHSLSVLSLAISADGETLVSGGAEGAIKVWNIDRGQLIRTLSGHTDGVWQIAIAPDRSTLYSSSWDKTIKIWNLSTGTEQTTLTGHTDYVVALALSADGKTLVSGDWDSQIYIWHQQQ